MQQPLDKATTRRVTEWLRRSLTGFGTPVAALVPGHYPAYARIYHPFGDRTVSATDAPTTPSWQALAGRSMTSPHEAFEFAMGGSPDGQAPVGTAPRHLIDLLLPLLAPATTMLDECYFAVWEGFGDLSDPLHACAPTLQLPNRNYHLFAGSLADARTSYSFISFGYRSANLWWPKDRAWFVATEVDSAWTYVAGPRACIDAILAHPRLDAIETTALAEW